ncbi:uncharacterized protein LOC141611905 isoform X2 [Silene latifolia]|uniref:uncharacterized protein LOC141611905 isoform X2 n=1 Tax=Silene latifolia TaxID=37657 RepID=UPI003D77BEAD
MSYGNVVDPVAAFTSVIHSYSYDVTREVVLAHTKFRRSSSGLQLQLYIEGDMHISQASLKGGFYGDKRRIDWTNKSFRRSSSFDMHSRWKFCILQIVIVGAVELILGQLKLCLLKAV